MKSIKFLTGYLLGNKKELLLGVLFTLLMSVTEVFPGMIYKAIADSLTNLSSNSNFLSIKIPIKILDLKYDAYKFSVKEHDRIFQIFVLICLLFLIIYILDALFRYLRDIYFNCAVQKILKEIKDAICQKLLNMPFELYKKNTTGDLMSRITYDVTILNNIIDVFVEISRSLIGLLIFCPILFYIDYKISLFAFLFFPVSLYLVKYLSVKMKRYSRTISNTTADYTEFIKDRIDRQQNIKLAGQQSAELNAFKSLTAHNLAIAIKNFKIKFFLKPSNEIIGIFGITVIAVYFCYQLTYNQMGAGNIALYLAVLKSAYKPFKKAAESIGDLHFSLAGADKIVALIDQPAETNNGKVQLDQIESIEFCNVGLEIDNFTILKDVSCKLSNSSHYGITGLSGSGKTSLSNLLPRFYQISSGQILINSQPIENYELSSLRNRIALVNNDNQLINGTIRENIGYGNQSDQSQICSEGIEKFLDIENFGLDKVVGKNGAVLSTGQTQKINLLQAIFKKADLLIIDEGLDLLSRKDIDLFFNLLNSNQILLVISRNQYVLDRMQRVYQLENGNLTG